MSDIMTDRYRKLDMTTYIFLVVSVDFYTQVTFNTHRLQKNTAFPYTTHVGNDIVYSQQCELGKMSNQYLYALLQSR